MPETITVIDARDSAYLRRIQSVWESRELISHFVRRDLVGRYRPTSLGIAWVFLKPAAELATYTLVFGFILRVKSADMPYPLHLACGLVPWMFFSQVVSGSVGALSGARHIMSKVHFPRLIVPLSHLGTALVDFCVLFALVIVMAVLYGSHFGLAFLALPAFLITFVVLALGISLLITAKSVWSPDVGLAMPVVLRVTMYLSPIVYPRSLVPERWHWLYDLNPISPLVTGIRWSLGSAVAPEPVSIVLAIGTSVAVFLLGIGSFLRTERRMVDFL
jgi:lipopolysaccharide transport system permease protein